MHQREPLYSESRSTGILFSLMVIPVGQKTSPRQAGELPHTHSTPSENARCNGFMDVAGSLLRHKLLSNAFTNATKPLITSLVVIKASLIKGITVTHDSFPNHLSVTELKCSVELKTGCLGLVYQQCLEVRTTHHLHADGTPQSSLV